MDFSLELRLDCSSMMQLDFSLELRLDCSSMMQLDFSLELRLDCSSMMQLDFPLRFHANQLPNLLDFLLDVPWCDAESV
jgi:hypothetical protein